MKNFKISAIITLLSLILCTLSTSSIEETHTSFSKTRSMNIVAGFDTWIPDPMVSQPYWDSRCLNVFVYPSDYPRVSTSFTFQISKSSTFSSPITLNLTSTSSATGKVTNLSLNTTYYYRARANDGYGADWSKTETYKTLSEVPSSSTYACM